MLVLLLTVERQLAYLHMLVDALLQAWLIFFGRRVYIKSVTCINGNLRAQYSLNFLTRPPVLLEAPPP
jgi:hypothetical protein